MSEIKYGLNDSLNSCDDFEQAVSDLNEVIKNDPSLVRDEKKLDEVIFIAENISVSARKILEGIEKDERFLDKKGALLSSEKIKSPDRNERYEAAVMKKKHPVSVTYHDGKLIIKTPYTFKRFYKNRTLKENYLLMFYIRAALIDWQNETKFDLFQAIETPAVLTIKRKIARWKPNELCDNDNMENGRIANEIVDALGYSDNVMTLSVFSCVEISEDAGMEFIICSEADFGRDFATIRGTQTTKNDK